MTKVSKIIVANKSASTAQIDLYIEKATDASIDFYLIKDLDIPAEATFVWDDEFSFDNSAYSLKVLQTTSTNISIIVN